MAYFFPLISVSKMHLRIFMLSESLVHFFFMTEWWSVAWMYRKHLCIYVLKVIWGVSDLGWLINKTSINFREHTFIIHWDKYLSGIFELHDKYIFNFIPLCWKQSSHVKDNQPSNRGNWAGCLTDNANIKFPLKKRTGTE